MTYLNQKSLQETEKDGRRGRTVRGPLGSETEVLVYKGWTRRRYTETLPRSTLYVRVGLDSGKYRTILSLLFQFEGISPGVPMKVKPGTDGEDGTSQRNFFRVVRSSER